MLSYGMFPSIGDDRKVRASFFAEYFSSFIGNGIFPNPSTNFQVLSFEQMKTVVKPGKAWINGYYVKNDGDLIMQHDIADGVLKRIDRIVLRINHLERLIEVIIKKGAFASTPVAPKLTRDADYYEMALADVVINNGATVITQTNITDTRLNNALCGIVHGTVPQVDTTTLFNQYQSWFAEQMVAYETDMDNWTEQQRIEFEQWQLLRENDFNTWQLQQQQEFVSWFASLQDLLDENVAATLTAKVQALETGKADNENLTQLQTQFNSHTEQNMPHQFSDDVTGQIYRYGFKAVDGVVNFVYEEVE